MSFLDDLGSWVGSLLGGDSSSPDSGSDYVNGSDLSSDLGESQSSDLSALGGGDSGNALALALSNPAMSAGTTGATDSTASSAPVQVEPASNANTDFKSPAANASPLTQVGRAAKANSQTSLIQQLLGKPNASGMAQGPLLLGLLGALLQKNQSPNAAAMRNSLASPYNNFTPTGQTAFNNYMAAPIHTYTPPTNGYVGHFKRGGSVSPLNYAMGGGVPPMYGPGSLGPGSGAAHNFMGNDQDVGAPNIPMGGPGMGGPGVSSAGPGMMSAGPTGVMGTNAMPGALNNGGPPMPAAAGQQMQPNSPLSTLRNKMQRPGFDPSQFADSHPNFAANHPWMFSSAGNGPQVGAPLQPTGDPTMGTGPGMNTGTMGAGAASYARGGLIGGDAPGQSDGIPINVSPGEYVVDADTVASLGDGNNAAGAAALDRMRQHVRSVKRGAGPGNIPPPISGALASLRGVR